MSLAKIKRGGSEISIFRDHLGAILNSHNYRLSTIKPSDWAEQNRIMGSDVSAKAGKFEYNYTPYLREIVDHLSLDSDARDIAIMKGAQIGFTTSVIENGVGFIIANQPGNIMLLARDESMVKRMMERRIDTMIDGCNIRYLIRPNSQKRKNMRSGDTSLSKEFSGGGIFAGSVMNPAKMRQDAIQYVFADDFEAAPRYDKEDGDTVSLIRTRTKSYAKKCKRYWISTPTIKQTSNIEPLYLQGDQRKYNVHCPCCGVLIVYEWHHVINNEPAGIVWKVDNMGRLVEGSVGYVCQSCGGYFDEKGKYERNLTGIWIPTSDPVEPGFYSYHISSLYAPPGQEDWTDYVREWIKIHPQEGKVDEAKYKVFMNTCLGVTYEEKGEEPKAKQVSNNGRNYDIGLIPEQLSLDDGNGIIVAITLGSDMNGIVDDCRLDLEITAWSEAGTSYSVDHASLGSFVNKHLRTKEFYENDREVLTYKHGVPNSVWPLFLKILQTPLYTDTGKRIMISLAGLDSGYYTEYAYTFLNQVNGSGLIIGIKGENEDRFRNVDKNNLCFKKSPTRSDLYLLDVNSIKDDLSYDISLVWDSDGEDSQPYGYMNYPNSKGDKYTWQNYFRHFESEHRVLKETSTGLSQSLWVKKDTGHNQNHFWDCRVYNIAIRDILAYRMCKENKVEYSWPEFCKIIRSIRR